jgi:hypothetical protein
MTWLELLQSMIGLVYPGRFFDVELPFAWHDASGQNEGSVCLIHYEKIVHSACMILRAVPAQWAPDVDKNTCLLARR